MKVEPRYDDWSQAVAEPAFASTVRERRLDKIVSLGGVICNYLVMNAFLYSTDQRVNALLLHLKREFWAAEGELRGQNPLRSSD
jgi:hypothetical protein